MLVTFEGQVGFDLVYEVEIETTDGFGQYSVIVEDLITGQVFNGRVQSIDVENELGFGRFGGRRSAVIVVRDPVVIEVKT